MRMDIRSQSDSTTPAINFDEHGSPTWRKTTTRPGRSPDNSSQARQSAAGESFGHQIARCRPGSAATRSLRPADDALGRRDDWPRAGGQFRRSDRRREDAEEPEPRRLAKATTLLE